MSTAHIRPEMLRDERAAAKMDRDLTQQALAGKTKTRATRLHHQLPPQPPKGLRPGPGPGPELDYGFLRAPPAIFSPRDSASSFDSDGISASATPSTAATTPHHSMGLSALALSVASITSVSPGASSLDVSPKASFGPHHGAAPRHLSGESIESSTESSPSDSGDHVVYGPTPLADPAISVERLGTKQPPRRKLVKQRPRGRRQPGRGSDTGRSSESEPEIDEVRATTRSQGQNQHMQNVDQHTHAEQASPSPNAEASSTSSAEAALKRTVAEIQALSGEMQRHGKRRVTRQKWAVTTWLVCVNFILIFATWWWPKYYFLYLPLIALPLVLNCCMIASVTVTQLVRFVFLRKTTGRSVAVPPPTPETFCMVMPCYNETLDECTRSLDSLVAQEGIAHHQRAILVICDGKVRGPDMDKTTAEYLQQDILTQTAQPMRVIRNAYAAWDGGSMDIEVTRGWYKGVPFYCIVKRQNQGKRDSLIVVRSFLHKFNQRAQNPRTVFGRDFLTDMTEWLELDAGINNIDHLIGMDADTVFDKGCILELLTQMRMADAEDAGALKRRIARKQRQARRDPEKSGAVVADDVNDADLPRTVGVCGYVAVDFSSGSFSPWHLYQNAEYSIAQGLRRLHQSIVTHKVSCLPGCCQLLRICEATCGDHVLVGLFGYHPKPLDGMLKRIRATASEDRNHVCLMLTEFPAARTRQALYARAYTDVPHSWSVFLSQRRRWTLGATSNDLLLMTARGTQWWERILALSNVLVWMLNVFVIASIGSMVVAFLSELSSRDYLDPPPAT
jgi:hypothetical protein